MFLPSKVGLNLALRFVRSRRKGALSRFISFASTCGIAIGVFAAVVGFSAMNGFEYELENRVLSIIPSAQLNAHNRFYHNGDDIERVLREDPRIVATAQVIEQQAVLSANRAFAPLLVAGIHPAQEKEVIAIQRFISIDMECLSSRTNPRLEGKCSLAKSSALAPYIDAEVAARTRKIVAEEEQLMGYKGEDNQEKVLAYLNNLNQKSNEKSEHTEDLNVAAQVDAVRDEIRALAAKQLDEIAAIRAAADGSSAYFERSRGHKHKANEMENAVTAALSGQNNAKLPRLLIGSGIARKLKVGVGDIVDLVSLEQPEQDTASARELSNSLSAPDKHKALVIGIVHIGGQLDTSVAIMDFDELKDIASLSGANSIHIKTNDLKNTHNIVFEASSGKIKESSYLVTWMSSQGKLYHDIQMVRQIMFVAMFLVLSVACFNIISNLMMMVGEKRREIAILLTMGMKPSQVISTFSLAGIISGGRGALIGLVAGVVAALLITPVSQSFKDWFGFDLLNEDVYFINFIPCRLEWSSVLVVLAVSLIMSWLAALYPAVRAAHINPAQELNI